MSPKKGKVYKIICTQSNDVYIGSTFNILRVRLWGHKAKYKNKQSYSLTPYFDKYGTDNFKIILIKEYEVVDRKHLEAYEQLWLNKLKNINKNNTLNLKHINKEQHLIKRRNYYQKIKDTKIKEYLEESKEKRSLQTRQYKEKNKDYIKQITTCECGGSYYKNDSFKKSRHEQTKKHLNALIR